LPDLVSGALSGDILVTDVDAPREQAESIKEKAAPNENPFFKKVK
jgi:hypothetical protein